jgi:prefoldin alpha subunit
MNELRESLEEINKNETKEMLINIGKKIYLPVEIKSKNLVVEVGNKSFVNKSVPDTIKLIEEQLGKLVIAKGQVTARLSELEGEIEKIVNQERGAGEKDECGCGHEHGEKCEDCDCEDDCDCDDECDCEHK